VRSQSGKESRQIVDMAIDEGDFALGRGRHGHESLWTDALRTGGSSGALTGWTGTRDQEGGRVRAAHRVGPNPKLLAARLWGRRSVRWCAGGPLNDTEAVG